LANHAKFIIEKNRFNKFKWYLINRNGHPLLISQVYKSKASCKKGIESVRKNGQITSRYEKLKSRNGKHHFNLKARNGLCLGSSEKYTEPKRMLLAIKNIAAVSNLARILDQT